MPFPYLFYIARELKPPRIIRTYTVNKKKLIPQPPSQGKSMHQILLDARGHARRKQLLVVYRLTFNIVFVRVRMSIVHIFCGFETSGRLSANLGSGVGLL